MVTRGTEVIITSLMVFLVISVPFVHGGIDIFVNEEFAVVVDEDTKEALFDAEFNFTLPSEAKQNVSVTLIYQNEVEGVVYERCYLKEASVFIDGTIVLNEKYERNVQSATITEHGLLSPGNKHIGKVILLGTSEGSEFYGTFSLYVERSQQSGGADIVGFFFGWWYMFVILGSGVIVVLIIRRRRRPEE